MHKADRIFSWAFGIVCLLFLLLGFIDTISMKLFPNTSNTSHMFPCETMYREEVRRIKTAVVQYAGTGKPVPTLDTLVADGMYTLPQDRKYKSPYRSTVKMQNMRVKLIISNEPYKLEPFKIILTSTKGRCPRGKTLLINSWDDSGEWMEEYPVELMQNDLNAGGIHH